MGKKDKKKGKGIEKTTLKTERKAKNRLKKELAIKGEEDVETLLKKLVEEDEKRHGIAEEVVLPPSKRSAFSLTAHPDKDVLIVFGGEFFCGNNTTVYSELFFYNVKQDKWIKLTSTPSPPPRSSHQAVAISQGGGQLWIFGGEFSSPSQSQFYHYKDLWVFHFSTKKWEKFTESAEGPSPRSGHRMVYFKKQLILFGGFHDNLREYKYYNDVYSFSLETYSWRKLEVTGYGPCPRSGCQMVSTSDGRIIIYGGYAKERVKKDVDKGITYSDMYMLYPDKHDTTGLKWKWQLIKPSGTKPSPRCAFAMALGVGDKAYLFGGVFDEEEKEEDLQGNFFNDLYLLDLQKHSWHQITLTGSHNEEKKSRRKKKEGLSEDCDMEDHVNDKMDSMTVNDRPPKQVVNDDGVFTVIEGRAGSSGTSCSGVTSTGRSAVNVPPPRINPGLVMKNKVLYLYGGMFEDGDKQLTLGDFYSLDLNKLEEWRTIIPLNPEDLEWFDSESEDEESDESEEDSEDDDDEEMVVD